MTSRLAEVAPERLAGWVHRFENSHGTLRVVVEPRASGLELLAADGARATVDLLWPGPDPGCPRAPGQGEHDPALLAADLAILAAQPRTALIVLVRRGGWGMGLARGGVLLVGATGTRYVQSRTAAGGWSQQRYARRRAGQASGLVEAAIDRLVDMVGGRACEGPVPEAVAVGGDRGLVARVLAGPALRRVAALPRSPLLEVADPRRRVLEDVALRVRCLRVRVDDPEQQNTRDD